MLINLEEYPVMKRARATEVIITGKVAAMPVNTGFFVISAISVAINTTMPPKRNLKSSSQIVIFYLFFLMLKKLNCEI